MEYIFTLRYHVGHADGSFDAIIDRLAESGCKDALIGMGQPGTLALEFSRVAPRARTAVRSALADVKRAMPNASLLEVIIIKDRMRSLMLQA